MSNKGVKFLAGALVVCAWASGVVAVAQKESERAKMSDQPLASPGKVLADEKGGRLFISDTNHNRIVVAKLDGTLINVVGTGAAGATDGAFERATFRRPQGLALDAGKNGDEDALYVADTENHLIRKVDLKARTVSTVAGTGQQSRAALGDEGARVSPARSVALNSPWDLQLIGRRLYIAMTGPHQIWRLNLATNTISVFAGTGREARVDGARQSSSFAQPSGLTTDGAMLFVADAESNAVRSVSLSHPANQPADDEPKNEADSEGNPLEVAPRGEMPPPGEDETQAVAMSSPTPTPDEHQVTTLAGGNLSDFGDVDGVGDAARLRHPLGVRYVAGFGVFISDTDNHKIKLLDVVTHAVKTVAGTGQPGRDDGARASFDDPGGLSYADGKLYVADTDNQAIRIVDPVAGKTSTLTLRGLTPPAATHEIKPQAK